MVTEIYIHFKDSKTGSDLLTGEFTEIAGYEKHVKASNFDVRAYKDLHQRSGGRKSVMGGRSMVTEAEMSMIGYNQDFAKFAEKLVKKENIDIEVTVCDIVEGKPNIQEVIKCKNCDLTGFRKSHTGDNTMVNLTVKPREMAYEEKKVPKNPNDKPAAGVTLAYNVAQGKLTA